MNRNPLLAALSFALLSALGAHVALCQASAPQPLNLTAVAPRHDCALMTAVDVSTVVGSPTIVKAATLEEGSSIRYCRVQAVVDDYAHFEMRLPASAWTQRLLFGGGPAAQVAPGGMSLEHFVTVSWQDLGRRGHEDDFARNYQYRINDGYRGMHLQVLAAKALIAKYYGQGPKYSYFNACSEPGREGMQEVQRFPQDFDGVGAGCPPINFTLNNGVFQAWNVLTNTDADGQLILTADKLPVLHQAILEQCDAADGAKDGIISNPFACHPDVTAVQCKAGQDPAICLTSEQVRVVQELYRGAHDSQGGKLMPIGVLPGSELAWTSTIAPTRNPSEPRDQTTTAIRSQFSDPALPGSWQLRDLKFDRASFDAITKLHYVYDATNPDLAAFAKAGHKLILWQGLGDSNVLPAYAVLYYTALQKVMGERTVDGFVRFYALPGVNHCGGGGRARHQRPAGAAHAVGGARHSTRRFAGHSHSKEQRTRLRPHEACARTAGRRRSHAPAVSLSAEREVRGFRQRQRRRELCRRIRATCPCIDIRLVRLRVLYEATREVVHNERPQYGITLQVRVVHRILSIIACAVMLYLGVTGSLIQFLDLREILGGAPETAAGMQSINEGKNGNAGYVVLTPIDYGAAPLPQDLDFRGAFDIVLKGLHEQKPDAQPIYVELRIANGVIIGQARFGQPATGIDNINKGLIAVDAATGAPAAPVLVSTLRPEPSFRQTLKEWHRFWKRSDVPGVYAELLSGVVLWALMLTGLTMYFRLLKQRRRLGRKQLFWMSAGRWRAFHRAVSVIAAVLLIWVALSGTWLGVESVWHTFQGRPPRSTSPGLNDQDILSMVGATLSYLHTTEPAVRLKILQVRTYAGMKQGIVVTDEPAARQLVFNLATGKPVSLTEPGYPPSGFPFGLQTHEDIKHLHSGFLLGLWARVLDLVAGLALIFLSVSGLVMYLEMWNKRRAGGRGQFFWK